VRRPLPRCFVRASGPGSWIFCLKSETGITLVEVLVSALIVALIGAAVGEALIGSTAASADQRHRSQAAEVAQQDQARLDGMASDQLDGLDQTRTVTLDGTVFTVVSTAQFLNSSGSTSCGNSGNGAAAYYKITSTVNWQANNRPPVVVESLITPAAGGTLLTQVDDQTGAGLSGATVTATGPDYESGVTQPGGCVVLPDLAAGSYTVTVSDLGYVDPNGNSADPTSPGPLSLASTVASTGVSTPNTSPVVIGQAGDINANFTTFANTGSGGLGTVTGQQADALSWYGSGTSETMSGYESGSLSSPGTLIPASGTIGLFPFYFTTGPSYTNNYTVWAGKCQQMEPPTANNVDKFSVSPASDQTLAVQEPALDVVVNYGGTRVAPNDVKLSFTSATGTSCNDSWYAPIAANAATNPNGSLASPGQPFATTATSGSTASASGLTGTYSVCADYNASGTYREATVANVQNNSFSGLNSVTVLITSSSTAGKC